MAEPGQEVAVGRQERIATLVVAALLAALGISWMVMASRFVPLAQLKPIDLTFVPYWSGAILALTSAFLFLRYWLVPAVPASELNRPPLFELAGQLRVLAALVALAMYILVLTKVHYLLSTFVLMVAGLLLSGEPVRLRLLIVAAVVTSMLYLLFLRWLSVPLPGSTFGS